MVLGCQLLATEEICVHGGASAMCRCNDNLCAYVRQGSVKGCASGRQAHSERDSGRPGGCMEHVYLEAVAS